MAITDKNSNFISNSFLLNGADGKSIWACLKIQCEDKYFGFLQNQYSIASPKMSIKQQQTDQEKKKKKK